MAVALSSSTGPRKLYCKFILIGNGVYQADKDGEDGATATATAVDSMHFLRPQRNKYGRLLTVVSTEWKLKIATF